MTDPKQIMELLRLRDEDGAITAAELHVMHHRAIRNGSKTMTTYERTDGELIAGEFSFVGDLDYFADDWNSTELVRRTWVCVEEEVFDYHPIDTKSCDDCAGWGEDSQGVECRTCNGMGEFELPDPWKDPDVDLPPPVEDITDLEDITGLASVKTSIGVDANGEAVHVVVQGDLSKGKTYANFVDDTYANFVDDAIRQVLGGQT